MNIKVLGSGCANCKKLEALVEEVVSEMDAAAEVQHVSDYKDIVRYGIMATPGLVIDGEVKSAGRIPSKAEITSWIVTVLSRG
ncbi:MAG: thioredoxin family protein [Chloroflexi bacterium]|nr:thioredoxin family protein [Chloroflexota bacterium]MDA8187063.1 thioredoxin family protein [Dehalococcoidales bacterium]